DRELAVDPELGVILTRLHHALGAPPAPPLLAAQLADVERLVGSVVPDVVLALLHAEGRSVGAPCASTSSCNRSRRATTRPCRRGYVA
ncbi:MAG: hypothetical protein K1X94_27570, partial [Sandaracinaceae bacterium]|nr:hypothetical protein [Sandaracinaceae bacterium]